MSFDFYKVWSISVQNIVICITTRERLIKKILFTNILNNKGYSIEFCRSPALIFYHELKMLLTLTQREKFFK